ncbi:MAG TPA: hypothetical protein VGL71_01440 [Urbifossiella sp.]|jgi:hypothetical protein
MNHSAKRQHHEQARKKLKHDRQFHAREVAKQPRPVFPRLLLAGAIAIVVAFVCFVSFGR